MAVNPGYVLEAAVVPGDLNYVWGLVKSMNYKFSKSVVQAKREEGSDEGALGQYSVAYSDNTVQTLRVTEISERLPTKRSLGMEMVSSDPPVDYSSRMDQICLSAVTHGKTPSVYVEFSSDFSSDVSMAVLEDSKFKKRDFFDDLIAFSGSHESSGSNAKRQKT
eukprot:CAMPEP_0197650234 /NCGR_PEP_ID=MMETSP1338-20131121/30816_1 /TAXON_ID=43686 ORGANISM="Pelagodinium beii, Strain RCC1491" /NCGR_SAMPLE_ID=MMETSP1338 /ASSEMBLY_ACC=CAM_ASM_000754 /LENGTH=163 /DNA_ID=CAMNT_0043224591 /DNA_START=47 /DNA_END=538 /DNA_ORIENTATION=+